MKKSMIDKEIQELTRRFNTEKSGMMQKISYWEQKSGDLEKSLGYANMDKEHLEKRFEQSRQEVDGLRVEVTQTMDSLDKKQSEIRNWQQSYNELEKSYKLKFEELHNQLNAEKRGELEQLESELRGEFGQFEQQFQAQAESLVDQIGDWRMRYVLQTAQLEACTESLQEALKDAQNLAQECTNIEKHYQEQFIVFKERMEADVRTKLEQSAQERQQLVDQIEAKSQTISELED